MIVKNGRLFLWQNNITTATFKVLIGEGATSNVKVGDTELNKEVAISAYDIQYSNKANPKADEAGDWSSTMGGIDQYLNATTRKITVFIKIKPKTTAIQLGEIGLFAIDSTNPEKLTLISKTMLHKQTLSNSETKVIKYTINI